jgi:hypothetical protein
MGGSYCGQGQYFEVGRFELADHIPRVQTSARA